MRPKLNRTQYPRILGLGAIRAGDEIGASSLDYMYMYFSLIFSWANLKIHEFSVVSCLCVRRDSNFMHLQYK